MPGGSQRQRRGGAAQQGRPTAQRRWRWRDCPCSRVWDWVVRQPAQPPSCRPPKTKMASAAQRAPALGKPVARVATAGAPARSAAPQRTPTPPPARAAADRETRAPILRP
eukprot:358412-Chlamydomonas_euryale.AAC.5